MRDIKDLIENVEKYKDVLLQKTFQSKKNTVAYVILNGRPRVIKWFVPGLKQNMDNEHSVLKKGFSDLPIPSPLEKDTKNNVLVMSYIMGENICDILNNSGITSTEKTKVIDLLADWFAAFHRFFRTADGFRIRGDATLRNFILSKGRVWGVDFEESRFGKPSEDLAALCASLLSTEPMFIDEKFLLSQTFLDSYQKKVQWSLGRLNSEISYALLERIQWRPQDEQLLRKYAIQVRTKGLNGCRNIL